MTVERVGQHHGSQRSNSRRLRPIGRAGTELRADDVGLPMAVQFDRCRMSDSNLYLLQSPASLSGKRPCEGIFENCTDFVVRQALNGESPARFGTGIFFLIADGFIFVRQRFQRLMELWIAGDDCQQ
ncbi:hypothetical protein [Rhizobium leguminosarum]|uniref:hypothetical protein n=1 Tax=Rhizobium leguminosarum TaxID=384 RepID=UPI0012F7241A|nr:hypothetical protein [Rhizobium leguminosarum]MBY5368163.1 hypothetical protein [Rhizobium leguminosarum]MBY5451449.1 hypothetical protein [Rhizobium leguminosarum]